MVSHNNVNVQEIEQSFRNVLVENSKSESGPSKDYLLSFFKLQDTPSKPPNACDLFFTDGECPETNQYAVPVTYNEAKEVWELIKKVQEESAKEASTLETLKGIVDKKKFYIAPLDGLHRIVVLYKLSKESPDIVTKKRRFKPDFVFVSTSNGKCRFLWFVVSYEMKSTFYV